jgi:Flp pilus assembly protein TadD, contains TPR repeats
MQPGSKPFVVKMVLGVSFLFLSLLFSPNIFAASVIEGTVYDRQRNALPDIDVELLDDYYRTIKRTKTNGSGRYQFTGLNDGRFTVRVLAFRYDFLDQEMPVEVMTQQGARSQGNGYFVQDFFLQPRKGGLRDTELSVVFAQEVPKEAEELYKSAIEKLSKKEKRDEGIKELWEAQQKFPKYFAALYRLGRELYADQQYLDAVRLLLKAVEVNPKHAESYYLIGLGLNKLGKDYNKSALTALRQAYNLAPASVVVLYSLGKVERELGMLAEAEEHLLQAKKLSPTRLPEIQKELAQLYGNDLKKYDQAADELELYLKASKISGEEEKKLKKTISDLREKAKAQASK